MKALYLEKPNDMYIKDVEEPVRKSGEALISIKMSGVCGTDIHSFTGDNANTIYPVIIGHEAVGTILEVDDDNPKGFKVGDRVVMEPYMGCGTCYACRLGRYNCCENLRTRGVHFDGMMAERISHPVSKTFKVPDDLTDEQACMIEPFTIGLQAAHNAKVQEGDICAIFGAGAIGLVCAMVCRAYGAEPILFDPVDGKLEKARAMGFENCVNNVKEDPAEYLKKFTKGEMAHVIFECSGAKPVIENLGQYLSACGRVVLIGWPHHPYSQIDTGDITRKEASVFGSRNSCNCFSEAIELIESGKLNPDPFISCMVDIEEAKETFEDMIKNPGNYMKSIIKIQD